MSKRTQIAVVTGLCLLSAVAGWGVAKLTHRAPPELKAPGVQHRCNICGSTKGFARFGVRKLELCRYCGSKSRHRLLAHYLEHRTPLFHEPLDVLHFGPDIGLMTKLKGLDNLRYLTADLFDLRTDLALDITAIAQPDESWDYILAYHILEHIVDDRKAMAELHRILRPGGQLILQVPLWPGQPEIIEDPTVTDPKERLRLFGQSDHVRRYTAAGLEKRLKLAGFDVAAIDYLGQLDQGVIDEHSLYGHFEPPMDQRIWVATKPATNAAGTAGSDSDRPD